MKVTQLIATPLRNNYGGEDPVTTAFVSIAPASMMVVAGRDTW